MQQVELSLTPEQAKKLMKGKLVQLSKKSLQGSGNWIALHPHTYKKVMKAKMSGKGIRITLMPDEMEASGEGLKDLLNRAGRWVKKEYRENIAPLVKKGVREALTAAEAGLSTVAPELAPFIGMAEKKYGDKLVEKIGQKTGAYGMMGGYTGPLLPMGHPAYNPVWMQAPGAVCPNCNYGGSFRMP